MADKLTPSTYFALGALAGTLVFGSILYRKVQYLQDIVDQRGHRPELIILLRHGESEANVNPAKYGPGEGKAFGDPNVKLTDKGREQAAQAGQRLAELIGARRVSVFLSPYERTRETARAVLHSLRAAGTRILRVREDPRIREREFCGTFQHGEVDRAEEASYSRFFWRPERGESCADVYDRVTSFIDTMWRDVSVTQPGAVLVISHGLTNRLILMRWLHWTPELFSESWNPGNCDILLLRRQPPDAAGHVFYRLSDDSMRVLKIEHLPEAAESQVGTAAVTEAPGS